VTVADIMSTDPLVIEEQESLVEATQRMAARGIRRTPVVDEFGNAIGILTVDDLLTLFSSELNIISRLFERETSVERTVRSS
jgi:signal-transduction protein with cAMP-binding, CBS, and nucleotidyltransferase domain